MAQTMLVASGKGGVGKSTVTCALATELSRLGKRVLVIDGDAGLRCQDILFDLSDRVVYDWGDVICGNIGARDAIIKEEGQPHLLPAPLYWSEDFSSEGFSKITASLEPDYDFIFIDAPAGIGPGLSVLSGGVRLALIVSGSDAAGIRGACAAGDILKEKGVVARRLIINSVKPALIRQGKMPDLDSVIDRTELRLIGVLPFDDEIALGAVKGTLAFKQGGLFSKAVTAVAKRVAGQAVPMTKF